MAQSTHIIAGPSVVNPGRTSNALVCGQDIFATVIDLFGFSNWKNLITINKPIDSKSIMPIIKNTSTSIQPWIFTEIFRVNPSTRDGRTIRNSHYKLLSFDNGTQKMFRIFGDPSEKTNLLDGDLTATELINYNYLCSEMSNLTGTGSFCNINVDLPKITISTLTTNVCGNAIVTFNANASKAGASPTYQWKKNGLIVGTNNSIYIDNTLADNDAISCSVTTSTSASANSNMGRENVIQESLLADYNKHPEFCNERAAKVTERDKNVDPSALSLWKGHEYKNHHWGMSIDLNTCTGCGACVVA